MPTPVSALIHAATMVTAGVYLLMRTSPLIEYSSTVLLLCLWVGAITTIFSSVIGLFQQDIKKVIAYSTMSQLAQKYKLYLNLNLVIFRHQTIYEEIINYIIIYYIKVQLFIKKILLKKVNLIIRPLSMQSIKKLNPYSVTGFIDGEGCFLININTRSDQKLGYNVNLMFKLKIHIRDKKLLDYIWNYFYNVGNITIRKDGYVELIVSSIKDIKVLINHFDAYPLITKKWADCQLFKQTFILINNKEHLTIEGLNKILSLKSVLNKGLSPQLKLAFPTLLSVIRPQTSLPKILDPNWISGFVKAEGCFFVKLSNTLTSASLVFKVTQHIIDLKLLEEFINYFNCGYYNLNSKMAGDFIVTKFNDINTIIIPFFKKYPIFGLKSKDFNDFVKVAELIQTKAHLTKEGIEKIKQIKSGMNKNKDINNSLLSKKWDKNILQISSYPEDKKYYSTTVKKLYNSDMYPLNTDKSFNEWLSGLIDGKGQLTISKKGYANFRIVLPEKDKFVLYIIKHKYGGSIKIISGKNAYRYKLHHKQGLIKLVNSINGLIRNPVKILQLNKICILYNINLKPTIPLTYNNGWFSGIIDADGSISLNEQSDQLILSITQKNRFILDPLNKLYLGRILILSSKEAFQYSIYRKNEILNLVDNYFNKYPLISSKSNKLKIIKNFYFYKNYKNLNEPDIFKKWINFKNKWDKL